MSIPLGFFEYLVWPTRLIYHAMGEVLCNGFYLVVLNPSGRRGHDTYSIVSIKGKKMGSISTAIDIWIPSRSCNRSYCITPFLHELNTLDACWIAVDVWSNI